MSLFCCDDNDNRLQNCAIARFIVCRLTSSQCVFRPAFLQMLGVALPVETLLKYFLDWAVYQTQIRAIHQPMFWFSEVQHIRTEKSPSFENDEQVPHPSGMRCHCLDQDKQEYNCRFWRRFIQCYVISPLACLLEHAKLPTCPPSKMLS